MSHTSVSIASEDHSSIHQNFSPRKQQPISTSTFAFHTSPAPPPNKRQRGIGEPHASNKIDIMYTNENKLRPPTSTSNPNIGNGLSSSIVGKSRSVDKTISTRRAELQKLKERLRPGYPGSSGVLAMARTHLDESINSRNVGNSKIPFYGSHPNSLSSQYKQNFNPEKPHHNYEDDTISSKSRYDSLQNSHPGRRAAPAPSNGHGYVHNGSSTRITTKVEPPTEEKKQEQDNHKTQNTITIKTNKPKSPYMRDYDNRDNSILVTPSRTTPTKPVVEQYTSLLQPRKLVLSSSSKKIEKARVDDNTKNENISSSTPTHANYEQPSSLQRGTISSPPSSNKTSSTTSSQDTKEISRKNPPPPPPPPPSTNSTSPSISMQSKSTTSNSTTDPIKIRAEKDLREGAPINSKRGFLYVVGKYAASENQSISTQSNTHPSTYTEGISTFTEGGVNTRSLSTRDTTSSQNTRRLVKQLREANEEKSAALRDVARLETELETRIRQQSQAQEGITSNTYNNALVPTRDHTVKNDSARSGALAMLICITERRVEKAILRSSWNSWKRETLGVMEEITPSRKRALDMVETKLDYNIQSALNLSGIPFTAESNRDTMLNSPVTTPIRYRPLVKSPVPNHTMKTSSIPKEYIQEAFAVVGTEYTSSIANFTIRTPNDYDGNFGVMPQDVYEEVVDPSIPETLEIRANILADESVLIVYGEMSIRHVKKNGEEIREVEKVDEIGILGIVSYIDCDGIENEYVLDDVFEQAISSRNSYCASLISAALVLRKVADSQIKVHGSAINNMTPTKTPLNGNNRNMMQTPVTPLQMNQNSQGVNNDMNNMKIDKPIFHDSFNATSPSEMDTDLHVSPTKANSPEISSPLKSNIIGEKMDGAVPSEQKMDETTPPATMKSQELPPQSSLVLTSLISFIFGSLFQIFWFVLIKLPLKIMRLALFYSVVGIAIVSIWFYFADDNGAERMGAVIDFNFRSEF